MLEYYDRILLCIASSLLGGVLLGLLTSLALHVGIFAGTVVATVFVYDAMFRNPPLPASDPRVAAAAIVWHAFLGIVVIAAYTS